MVPDPNVFEEDVAATKRALLNKITAFWSLIVMAERSLPKRGRIHRLPV